MIILIALYVAIALNIAIGIAVGARRDGSPFTRDFWAS